MDYQAANDNRDNIHEGETRDDQDTPSNPETSSVRKEMSMGTEEENLHQAEIEHFLRELQAATKKARLGTLMLSTLGEDDTKTDTDGSIESLKPKEKKKKNNKHKRMSTKDYLAKMKPDTSDVNGCLWGKYTLIRLLEAIEHKCNSPAMMEKKEIYLGDSTVDMLNSSE